MEIGTALRRDIRVIPVLVDGALMPLSTDLPEDLRPLVRRNALSITDTSFEGDCQRLVAAIKVDLERAAAEERKRLEAKQREKERLEAKQRAETERRSPLERATKENPWVNSLGMKFAPVAGTQVLFSIWDTRVQDFEAFVGATNYDATGGMWSPGGMWSLGKDEWKQLGATWRKPGFSQGPTHPVVGVSWNDAKKFCEWLTGREQGSGMLPRGQVYRLPTDAEWSAGVGLQGEVGNNPKEKDGKIELYPWGKKWPPPKGAGNYAGEEAQGEWPSDWRVIEGYNDGYPRTSPVGSFAANANGLYDMGGNVWQWCEDSYVATKTGRVVRGASWSSFSRGLLIASSRNDNLPVLRIDDVGFRCVVGAESSR
jgi:formylglycine-generating enzyme required for sulfatase activity